MLSILVFVSFVFSSVSISMPAFEQPKASADKAVDNSAKHERLLTSVAPNMAHNELPMVLPSMY